MNPVVGIDPGLRDCGVGVVDVDARRVLRGWLARNPITSASPGVNDGPEAWRAMARIVAQEVREVLVEIGWTGQVPLMAVERQYIGPNTPNQLSIMRIVGVVGALSEALPAFRIVEVMPSQWKHTASKKHANKMVWASMRPEERELAGDAKGKTRGHNVKDGLGIAQWAALNYRLLMETGSAKGSIRAAWT